MAVISVPYLMLFCCTMQNNHLPGYNYVKRITIVSKEILTQFAEASSSQNSKRKQTAQKPSQKRPEVFDREGR